MDTEVPPILQLNADCLERIFSYLDFPELLVAGSVCQTFEGIAQMFYRTYRNVDFEEISNIFRNKRIHHPGLRTLFRQLEPRMDAMKINDLVYEKTFGCPGFPTLFPNLQHIFLGPSSIIHEEYAKVFPELRQIVLHTQYLRDESVANRWFRNSSHLKILKFFDIGDMTGQCLIELKGIEELKINKCVNIQEEFFEEFCKLNPQLKKLSFDFHINPRTRNNINRCNTFMEIITKYLKNLESIVICHTFTGDDDPNFEILRDLPKITKMRIDFQKAKVKGMSGMLGMFVKRIHIKDSLNFSARQILNHFPSNNQIEYLNVNFQYELLTFLRQFSNLKVLIVQNFFLSLDDVPQSFPSSATLEELHLLNCSLFSADHAKEFVERFGLLRLFNLCGYNLAFSHLMEVDFEECLQNRSQILEIAVNGTPFAEELKKEPKSHQLKDFLNRTKDKVKFSIDSFTKDGKQIKFFHEREEWEGEPSEDMHSD